MYDSTMIHLLDFLRHVLHECLDVLVDGGLSFCLRCELIISLSVLIRLHAGSRVASCSPLEEFVSGRLLFLSKQILSHNRFMRDSFAR